MDQVDRFPARRLREIQAQALGKFRSVDLDSDWYALDFNCTGHIGDLYWRGLTPDGIISVSDGRCGAGCTARTMQRRETGLQEETVRRRGCARLQRQIVLAPVADGVVVAGGSLGLLRAECCYNLKGRV